MHNVKDSHTAYFNEKHYSILTELKNLYYIINYYKAKQLQRTISPIVDTFSILEEDIKALILHIESVRSDNKYGLDKVKDADNSLDFLTRLDAHKEEIEHILEYFSALHQKCIQIIYETSPQVLPHPLLQKRYSSKVLSEFLEEHTQNLYTLLTDKKEKKILSYWTHKEDYRVTKGIVDTLVDFNGQSFYYHDLMYSIPVVIDHEIILLAIKGNEKVKTSIDDLYALTMKSMIKYQNIKKTKLQENLDKIFENTINENKLAHYIEKKEYQKRIDNFLEQFRDVLWELFADYIGFLMYGDAYKLAFLHETLSKSLGRGFYDKEEGLVKKSINIGFNKKRDGLILRQLLVLNFQKIPESTYPCSKLLLSTSENDYIQMTQKILESFIGYGSNNESEKFVIKTSDFFKSILSEYKNSKILDKETKKKKELEIEEHIEILKEYENFMQSFYEVLEEILNKKKNLWDECKFIANKFTQNEYFKKDTFAHTFAGHPDEYSFALEIWRERFSALEEQKIPHRSLLRKHILNYSNEHTAYIMEFERSLLGDMQVEGISLGLFDNIRIREAIQDKEDRNNNRIDINKRIENLLDIRKLDSERTSFIKKHSLLKVFDEGNTRNTNCTLYLQLFLKNSRDVSGINKIIKYLTTDEKIKKVVSQRILYKSLGPEDLVYELKNVEQKNIWIIIEYILTHYKDYFLDSYTIIQLNTMTLDKNIWIKSKCKLQQILTYDAFILDIKNASELNTEKINDEKLQIFDMTGNHDFELWWNVDDFNEILETYNNLKEQNIISEMQFYLMNDISNRATT